MVYYWTINGAWLLDSGGNKIRVTGNDDQDGQDGQNGVTPQLKIEDGMWYVSYDGGTTWVLAGQATGATGPVGPVGPAGPAGQDGQDGDSMFQSVTQDADNVYFTLADGTVIVVAKRASAYSGPIINNGAVMAAYSVSATRQVYFSMGNLQYQASTDTWRFALHQYDFVGIQDNLNASATYSGWIDLFGWATSGYYDEYDANYAANHQLTYCYHPWDRLSNGQYGPHFYGEVDNCLVDYYANYDWGFYNAISNGGNQAEQWRTLRAHEWEYLFFRRGISPITVSINGIQGYMLRPDNYSSSVDSLLNVIEPSGDYSSGVSMDTLKWKQFENKGCILLPNAGSTGGMGYGGNYWSSDKGLALMSGTINWSSPYSSSFGFSVRLIKDVKQ